MKSRKQGCELAVVAILGLAFVVIAIFMGLVQAGRTLTEARDLDRLPILDAAGIARSERGATVLTTGRLAGEAPEDDGMLIYIEQEWQVEYDDEDGWEGSWQILTTVVPQCTLIFDNGTVPLNTAPGAALGPTAHEVTVYTPSRGREVDGTVEGTVRRLGFREADLITVVGTIATEGITPTRIAGGDRDVLMAYLSQQVTGLRIVGAIFGLVGVTLVVVAVVLFLRPS